MAAPSPRRWRRWSPHGRSRSRSSSSSATAWAGSSRAAPAATAEEAGQAWRKKLGKLVFLGTPHHGAPLERIGNWVDVILGKTPYAGAFATLGKIRSAGVTDLRYGNLLDEDWQGRDRFAREPDPRRPVPLPKGVACYAIAATTARRARRGERRAPRRRPRPVASALGRHKDSARALNFPHDRQWIACETGHLDLLSRRDVYERIAGWLRRDG